MRVSLICTVLNEGATIERLLDSIVAQSRQPDEVVLVDGGSRDDTLAGARAWQARHPGFPLLVLVAAGASIARGRNLAIEAARGDVIAVTDAGVRLHPHWLARLLEPFESHNPPDVVSGFFVADPCNAFELALGATTLPDADEIDWARFLPSSRSVAFTREAWLRAGRYPEWLDYCEDLILDINLREVGARFASAPEAFVYFRPRPTAQAFALQYFRYARGDGKADLWRRRHAVRYGAYFGLPLLAALLPARIWVPVAVLGGLAYLRRPYRRLAARRREHPPYRLITAALLIPWLRLLGDLAKMAGYPLGVCWRLRRRPPRWRLQRA